MTLQQFFKEHLIKILPIYEKHEQTFDPYGIHGRAHIIRSLLIAEVMMNYIEKYTSIKYQWHRCYFAIAFHDAGRKDNGPDFWEIYSARLCFDYMLASGYCKADALLTSSYITEKEPVDDSHRIVLDADTLEILRILDIRDFDRKKLNFINIKILNRNVIPRPQSLIQNLCQYVVKSSGDIAYLMLENKMDNISIIKCLTESLITFHGLYELGKFTKLNFE